MAMTVKSLIKTALVSFVITSLAACASKPVQTVVNEPPAQQPPVYEAPNQPPVAQRPIGIIPGSQQDFVVNIGDRVYFDTDQSSLRADAATVLSAQASWLARYPSIRVRIEGNADERGTREYNFALGARRAEAVAAFLTSHGVVPERISTISYGKENPIDTGATEEAWAVNRNAHTTITSGAR